MKIERHLGELAAAHRLMSHGGACELLHGHNWDLTVWVEATVDPKTGIAVDFLDFDAFRSELWKELDHGIWLHRTDDLARVLERGGVPVKLTLVDGEPTAENIALIILERLASRFPQASRWGVRLGEMAGCTAEVTRG
ncbi:MAG: 6-pyruvoyltetrahydropterin/6-carboxytetrahydropterin synthase [Candidatus Sumerlaeota bacterium]|nr:6-pyruvoyltetrahydropterin/6-carboxytetrahydropterin synthase [Candidatus Sumerlaeota bacterium]